MQLRQYQAAHVVLVIVKWLTVDGVIGYKSMWDRKLPFSDRHWKFLMEFQQRVTYF